MSYTKRQLIHDALLEAGLESYAFDMQPEQLQSAMRRLDAMMASWNANGLRLGYNMPPSPELGDLDSESGIPDSAYEAVILSLAIRLSPQFGKTAAPETRGAANQAMIALNAKHATIPQRTYPSDLPVGAGNKPDIVEENFMPRPADPILAGNDGPMEFN